MFDIWIIRDIQIICAEEYRVCQCYTRWQAYFMLSLTSKNQFSYWGLSCILSFFLENLQVFRLILGEGTRSKLTLYKNSIDSCFNCERDCFRLSFYNYCSLLSRWLVPTDNEYTSGCCNYTGLVRSCRIVYISDWEFVIWFTLHWFVILFTLFTVYNTRK